MKDKDSLLGKLEVAALTQVVLASAIWAAPILRPMACGWMSVATVLLAFGRFLQTPFYEKYALHDPRELTLRRLYHQRVFGMVALILAAMLMWMPTGFYWGLYVGASSWLILFILFAVVEVYTTFRISAVEKG